MSVPAPIRDFVKNFYTTTDEPDHDAYVDLFTPDATANLGGVFTGHDQIRKWRTNGWDRYSYMRHGFDHIYVTDTNPNVALVTGTVDLDRKVDGTKIRNLEYAARLVLKGDQDNLKLHDYMVWVVCIAFFCSEVIADCSTIPHSCESRRIRQTQGM